MKALSLAVATFAATGLAQQALWEKCGGQRWSGPTTCVSGAICIQKNQWYSQCVPVTGNENVNSPSQTTLITVIAPTETATVTAPSGSSGQTKYAGINIAGFDFCVETDGSCDVSKTWGPITAQNDGVAQMQHFVRDNKLNAFRLPVAWQYLVNNQAGGTLYSSAIADFDKLMQGCLATGALCIIDIHNYARWNGGIVGQGGPSNDDFSSLWSQLAQKYASNANAAFGIMNEPHELDVSKWADTAQAAVTAIRKAGATSQYILLPGTDYSSVGGFIYNSASALLKVKDSDGSTDKLIFDVHRYLDAAGSGKDAECVTDSTDILGGLADWLRTNKRMAFLSEFGGGNTESCEKFVCQLISFLDKNADVYLGYTGWAAGSFQSDYPLSLRPNGNTDSALAGKCFTRA